jgi:hypothetical protein
MDIHKSCRRREGREKKKKRKEKIEKKGREKRKKGGGRKIEKSKRMNYLFFKIKTHNLY